MTSRLRGHIDRLNQAMQPIFQGNFMEDLSSTDIARETPVRNPYEVELPSQLAAIREAYIPELIIAYNSALCFAGHTISRDYFILAMEIAVALAKEENEHLAKTFVKTGRMQEFMQAMALTSQAMLKYGNEKEKRNFKTWEGQTVKVWDLATQE
jgi:nuclear pore complex protein Nup107